MKGKERLTVRDGEAVYTSASEWELRYRLAEYEDVGSVEDFKAAVVARDQLIKNLKIELSSTYGELIRLREFKSLQEVLEDDGK